MKCPLSRQRPLKKTLDEAYEEGFDMIFNYGYGYYAFAHNICGNQPEVPDGMPDMSKSLSLEFFINPRWPPSVVLVEAASIDIRPGEATNALERAVIVEMDNSEVGKHLSAAEVGPGNEAKFST